MHEPQPLWIVFPKLDAMDPCTQGAEEVYYAQWLSFWKELTPELQSAYLDRWNAPLVWREAISWRDEMANLNDDDL
jgi:hypothetical protein